MFILATKMSDEEASESCLPSPNRSTISLISSEASRPPQPRTSSSSSSQSTSGAAWVVNWENSFLSQMSDMNYRVTSQLESYILLQSIWGVPPACGPLLQLATAHAGQGNSLNEAGNRLDTEKMLQPQSLTRWKYRVFLTVSFYIFRYRM